MSTPPAPPINFDGWVMINEYNPGVLLMTDIEEIDTDHQDAPNCDGEHAIDRAARWALSNPEEATVLCHVCVLKLWEGRQVGGYLMGALPAN